MRGRARRTLPVGDRRRLHLDRGVGVDPRRGRRGGGAELLGLQLHVDLDDPRVDGAHARLDLLPAQRLARSGGGDAGAVVLPVDVPLFAGGVGELGDDRRRVAGVVGEVVAAGRAIGGGAAGGPVVVRSGCPPFGGRGAGGAGGCRPRPPRGGRGGRVGTRARPPRRGRGCARLGTCRRAG